MKEITIQELTSIIKAWIRYFLSQWKKLALAVLLGLLIGIGYAYLKKPTYTARLTFIMEEGKSGGTGLSSLAGQFGLDIGSFGIGGASNMLVGDNIIGLLRSKKFVEVALLTPYSEGSDYSLADKYADIYELRKEWIKKKKVGNVFFPATANGAKQNFTRLQDSLLQVIGDKILLDQMEVLRSDKKMTFFEVKATFRDDLLAKLFIDRLVVNTIDFYIETKTRRSRVNVARLEKRVDSIGSLLNARTFQAAIAQSKLIDINPAYQATAVPAELSSRDKMMVGTIYAEIVKNLEIQKAALTQETPVIQIVDEITLPVKKNKVSYGKSIFLGVFVVLIITLAFLFVRRLIK